MAQLSTVNTNNPAVKRILREAREIAEATPTPDFDAKPLDGNLFEWHFSIRGPAGTAFDGGVYHGKIMLPAEYPFKPPSITLLTPNGRFEVGKKICLSVSAHHPEHWQPAWDIRTIITALIAFFPTKVRGTWCTTTGDRRASHACASPVGSHQTAPICHWTFLPACFAQADGALAGLDYSDAERRSLAAMSMEASRVAATLTAPRVVMLHGEPALYAFRDGSGLV